MAITRLPLYSKICHAMIFFILSQIHCSVPGDIDAVSTLVTQGSKTVGQMDVLINMQLYTCRCKKILDDTLVLFVLKTHSACYFCSV